MFEPPYFVLDERAHHKRQPIIESAGGQPVCEHSDVELSQRPLGELTQGSATNFLTTRQRHDHFNAWWTLEQRDMGSLQLERNATGNSLGFPSLLGKDHLRDQESPRVLNYPTHRVRLMQLPVECTAKNRR
jgi:hypothetical protein